MRRTHLYVLAFVLTSAGLTLFLYKVMALGFPLSPENETRVWRLQARFTIEAAARPVRATLQIRSRCKKPCRGSRSSSMWPGQ